MVIDANLFWMPERLFTEPAFLGEFLSAASRVEGTCAYEADAPRGGSRQIVVEKPKGYQNLNYGQGQYDLETQLDAMDAAGVDRAVLKLPGCQEWLSLELCAKFNDGLAEHVRRGKGRFAALAVVPPRADPDCLHELERCAGDLGMRGVQLSTHYGDRYLDDAAFRPFLKKLDRLGMTAYIHHSPLPVQYDSILDYNNLRRFYGRCADQATAVGREIFSGMFEDLPNLKFVHSVLGGAVFALQNLFFPGASSGKDNLGRFQGDSDKMYEYYREHIYFEMSYAQPWGGAQLECAVKTLGADHVLFGSSYPIRREWLTEGPDFVRSLDIPDAGKDLILGGNARALYHLDGAA